MDSPFLRQSNLNLLVALERLLTLRSVRLAAEACGVTQSAMSHTLSELRKNFNDPLLVRRGNQMLLSPRAEALASPLSEALAGLEAALRDSAPFDARTACDRFTIAASDAVAVRVLPGLLRLCAEEAPGVEIAVVPYDRSRLKEALASGDIDLALGPPMEDTMTGVSTRALYVSDFVVVLRRDHPAARRPLDLDAYCSLRHVVVNQATTGKNLIDELLARKNRQRRVVARVPYFLAAPLIVAETDLVLTSPRPAVERLAEDLGLRLVECPVNVPSTRIGMFFHVRFAEAAPQRWLRESVTRCAE